MSVLRESTCTITQKTCCQTNNGTVGNQKKKSNYHKVMGALEKISAIALGALSAYINWQLYVPFFAVGVAIGIYSYFKDKKACPLRRPGSSCTQGLLEQLTGVKLPAPVGLAVNIAVTVCHLDHHSSVFVPIVGVSLGAWAGKCMAPLFRRSKKLERSAAAA